MQADLGIGIEVGSPVTRFDVDSDPDDHDSQV